MFDYIYKASSSMLKRPASKKNKTAAKDKLSVFKLSLPIIKNAVASTKISDDTEFLPENNQINQLAGLGLQDILEGEDQSIIAYPESDINELLSIMTTLGIECIPVVKTPWDKTLVGFVHLKNLKALMK